MTKKCTVCNKPMPPSDNDEIREWVSSYTYVFFGKTPWRHYCPEHKEIDEEFI